MRYITKYIYQIESQSWRGLLDTTLWDKVCQWLATGRWFSPDTPGSSINKTDRHNITEMLLKMALNTISLNLNKYIYGSKLTMYSSLVKNCEFTKARFFFQHLHPPIKINSHTHRKYLHKMMNISKPISVQASG